MNATVKSSAFKTGNSVAVRLPKAFGVKAGETFELVRKGSSIELRPLVDPAEEQRQMRELIAELEAIGPVPDADTKRDDGRIEFPHRPGRY